MAFEILLLTFSSKILELSHGGHKADLWGSENCHRLGVFKPFPDDKESACNAEDPGSIPKLGRSPGEGRGNPLQYSCLESSMDRGVWQATVHGLAKESNTSQ